LTSAPRATDGALIDAFMGKLGSPLAPERFDSGIAWFVTPVTER
jgi:hypothetical protein